MAKNHKEIDWEYVAESIAQRKYFSKNNEIDYSTLKNIAEEEVMWYMNHDEDSLREMRKRITFRYKYNIRHISEYDHDSIWYKWREKEFFMSAYERNLKIGCFYRKYF